MSNVNYLLVPLKSKCRILEMHKICVVLLNLYYISAFVLTGTLKLLTGAEPFFATCTAPSSIYY